MGKGIEPGMIEKTRQKLLINQADNQVKMESSLDSRSHSATDRVVSSI